MQLQKICKQSSGTFMCFKPKTYFAGSLPLLRKTISDSPLFCGTANAFLERHSKCYQCHSLRRIPYMLSICWNLQVDCCTHVYTQHTHTHTHTHHTRTHAHTHTHIHTHTHAHTHIHTNTHTSESKRTRRGRGRKCCEDKKNLQKISLQLP